MMTISQQNEVLSFVGTILRNELRTSECIDFVDEITLEAWDLLGEEQLAARNPEGIDLPVEAAWAFLGEEQLEARRAFAEEMVWTFLGGAVPVGDDLATRKAA